MSYMCYNDAIGIRGEEPENEARRKGSKVEGGSGSKSHDIVDRSRVEGSGGRKWTGCLCSMVNYAKLLYIRS